MPGVQSRAVDPRFQASPPQSEIAKALALWPEIAGLRVRPLLVSAFGDIYVESARGEVLVADPLDLTCEVIAPSATALGEMFVDPDWADERLMSELVLLAEERGIIRLSHQVFAAAPHPSLSGELRLDHLLVMDLLPWHQIATQLRTA